MKFIDVFEEGRPAFGASLPPEAVVAGAAPLEVALWHGDAVALVLRGLRCYAEGFEVVLGVLLRAADPGLTRGLFPRMFDRSGAPDVLRLTIGYADGRRASTEATDGPALSVFAVEAQDARADLRIWMAGLPPPGPVEFTADWPVYGVAGARVAVPGEFILDAAARSYELWP